MQLCAPGLKLWQNLQHTQAMLWPQNEFCARHQSSTASMITTQTTLYSSACTSQATSGANAYMRCHETMLHTHVLNNSNVNSCMYSASQTFKMRKRGYILILYSPYILYYSNSEAIKAIKVL